MKTVIFIDGGMAEKFCTRESFDDELLAQYPGDREEIYRPVMIIDEEAFYSCAEPVLLCTYRTTCLDSTRETGEQR